MTLTRWSELQEQGGFHVFTPRSRFRLTGSDRVRYLNGQVSNDVSKAAGSKIISACVLTAKGKMCGLVWIRAHEETLEIDAASELREPLGERLERYIIADDVELADISDGHAIVHVFGAATEKLEKVDHPVGEAVRLDKPGKEFWLELGEAENLAAALREWGLLEATPTEWEELRIRAGVPLWGRELDENTLPQEAGLETASVDFFKGCYVGQEVVSRIRSVGRVNRVLKRLEAVPGSRAAVGDGLFTPEGTEVGRVTSVGSDFGLANRVMLGYVKTPSAESGAILRVSCEEGKPGEEVRIQ